jgi:asparagine synthase (glutamine-hydrolysing)
MCGICGFVARRGADAPDEQRVSRAVLALKHRGPDGSGVHATQAVALGHTRLSIIDVSGGAQPIWNETRTMLTVFNGEIWNHESLRRELERLGHRFQTRADTEVLIHGYEEWGSSLPEHLDGMFAFAVWDEAKEQLFLARDRVGKKPLYISETAHGLAFGSDIRSVLLSAGLEPRLSEERIAEFLFQRYVTAPNTLVGGVEKIEPGTQLIYDRERVSRRRFWRLSPAGPDPLDPKELRALLLQAVEKRLMSDVPLGVFLSGGVDSTAVLGLMVEAGARDLTSFTIGYGDYGFDERRWGRLMANHLGVEHHERIVARDDFLGSLPRLSWYRDEPVAEPSEIPLLLLSELAGAYVKVVLTGDGGDEVFGGYPKYRAERLLRLAGPVAAHALRIGAKGVAGRGSHRLLDRASETMLIRDSLLRWASWFRTFGPDELSALIRTQVTPDDLVKPLRRVLIPYGTLDAGRQMLVGDFLTYLPDNMLSRSDKVLMAASVEGRMPLVDQYVVEQAANAPANSRAGVRAGKALLRKAVSDLIPRELLRKPKRGFVVPLGPLLVNDPAETLQRLVLSERALDRGLFDPDEVRATTEDRREPLKLFTLAMLELWLRSNVDEIRLSPPSAEELFDDFLPGSRAAGRSVTEAT